jgi:hypothetical protein
MGRQGGGYSAAVLAVAAFAFAAVVGADSDGDSLAGLAGGAAAGIDAAPGTYARFCP